MDVPRFRILILTPQLPFPPRQGTSIRNYHLIRELAQRHDIDLVSFLAPDDRLDQTNPLRDMCGKIETVGQTQRTTGVRVRDTIFSAQPDMGLRLMSEEMVSLVNAIDHGVYDLIQIEGIEMAPYILSMEGRLDNLGRRRPVVVFDDHNCEYLLQQRNAQTDLRILRRWPAAAYSLVQTQKLRRFERLVCDASDLVVTVSAPDQTALERLGVTTPLITVPNGIDSGAHNLNVEADTDETSVHNIVFTGKMDYRPNIDAALWFGNEVFPMIQSRMPDAIFQIVGQQPHPRLDALRRSPGVSITGAVPSIEPYLSRASVFVIPMRVGGGTRFKALEAMAAGLPTVTTSLGIEGIGVQDGREMLIRDAPDEFANAVTLLIQDRQSGGQMCSQLGEAARAFVAAKYDWTTIVPKLENAYFAALNARNS